MDHQEDPQDPAFPAPVATQPRDRETPINISTISQNWEWGLNSTVRGLEALTGVHEICIQQMIELDDMMANIKSENRYKIYIPNEDRTIFYASEASTNQERLCFGLNRTFSISLFDQFHTEVATLNRFSAYGCCTNWFGANHMEVWAPQEGQIGAIAQRKSFEICGNSGNVVYRLDGPYYSPNNNVTFGICSAEGFIRLGNITHQWDQVQNEYNISVKFASSRDKNYFKILQISSALLLEYIYFLPLKRSKSRICC